MSPAAPFLDESLPNHTKMFELVHVVTSIDDFGCWVTLLQPASRSSVLGHLSSLRPHCVRSFPIGWLEYFLRDQETKAKASRQKRLCCVCVFADGSWQMAGDVGEEVLLCFLLYDQSPLVI